MANEFTIGFGAALTMDATPVVGIAMMQIPAREFGESEVTSIDQADIDRVFIPTLRDNGTATAELYASAENVAAALALHGVKNKTFVCKSPDPDGEGAALGKTFTITGFLKKIGETKYEKDQPNKFTIEIRCNKIVVSNSANVGA
ncbi:hypothetical protein [Limnoglobus roseus]|uniref:Phage tail protein n=1 Tax=Limnoglobus roseus TaxID=2598579 RepID=A0A5C1AH35_9BACT|nr:hypothetical protein [Limnoglobus roseus]QEL18531.1 hypothetical protein PX52LOC_05558 [Limnoglobus roseus]